MVCRPIVIVKQWSYMFTRLMNGQDKDDGASSEIPSDTAFRQQRLPAIQPIVTPAWVVGLFVTIGVLFVPLGAWLKLEYADVVEMKQQYGGDGSSVECGISAPNEGRQCQVTFDVSKDMARPIYVYYELTKFYQNHRTYVKSRSSDQLAGGVAGADSCDPLTVVGSADLNPCGLVASSMFNDVIVVDEAPHPYDPLSPYDFMDESGISWASDLDGTFAQPDAFVTGECALAESCEDCLGSSLYDDCSSYMNNRTGRTYKYWYPGEESTLYLYESYPEVISPVEGVTDEHFVVWMRTAAQPTFRKLYGRIDNDVVAPAKITFNITANFYVAGFGGTKSLVMTTGSPVGNRNEVLGGAFMAVGGACLVAGLVVLSKFQATPRELADVQFLGSASGKL